MELIYFLLILLIAMAIPLVALKLGREWLIALAPIYLITANVFAESFLPVFGYLTSLAIPIYAATFLVTDLLSEHYGKDDARRAVFAGLIGQLIFVSMMLAVINAPILSDKLAMYKNVFSFLPRLIFGSFVAYLVSQNWDIFVYHSIMKLTGKDKLLWLRNNASSMSSQLIDTIIFLTIAFYGRPPFDNLPALSVFIFTTWVVKLVVASIDTPYLYFSRIIVRRSSK